MIYQVKVGTKTRIVATQTEVLKIIREELKSGDVKIEVSSHETLEIQGETK